MSSAQTIQVQDQNNIASGPIRRSELDLNNPPKVGQEGYISPAQEKELEITRMIKIWIPRKSTKAADREWMYIRKINGKIVQGFEEKVDQFIEFSISQPKYMNGTKIKCPCDRKSCRNKPFVEPHIVAYHIVSKGFKKNYYNWVVHGEAPWTIKYNIEPNAYATGTSACEVGSSSSYECGNTYEYNLNANDYEPNPLQDEPNTAEFVPYDGYRQMLMDAAGPTFQYPPPNDPEPPNPNAQKFYDAMKEQQTPLYDGCSHSVLSAVTQLTSIKSDHGFSEVCYDRIARLMCEMMPEGNCMPESFYETKKLVESLGLPVQRIDCCSSGCMLYWGDDINRTKCKICNIDRGGKSSVLWYFPLKDRLQRLYASEATAKHMRWHTEHESDPEIMTHPSDAEAWKHFNTTHPWFANETRNVRLALCSDGFMPFGQYGRNYSCWPVILNPYNLPPGMCMKEEFMYLTLLVPGPRNPKQKIDVFLQPLIAELKDLWHNGSLTYDCSRKENFMMYAALMWTINDFPAYAMLSGWSTQGQLACPICMEDTDAFTLPKGKKQSWFDNHRKFLPPNHPFRKDKDNFVKDKGVSKIACPRKSGEEILEWMDRVGLKKAIEPNYELHNRRVKRQNEGSGWKKRSIFWDLPYWKSNLIRHNLDVMHIEKNCFENVFNTVMDIKGKTKDNLNSRLDLKTFCKRPNLDKNQSGVYPPGRYILDKKKSAIFLDWVKKLKFPDGYVSNMGRCVEKNKHRTGGMKSHDCHVFMQRLLPIAFRELLERPHWEAITEFSLFFKELTCTTLRVEEMKRLEVDIPIILCKLEKIFPPSFFDSMEHLTIHLAYEARIGGPVQYRWMYPYERIFKRKKQNVGNKAQVEGSISNAYLTDEISHFGSLYFEPHVYTRSRKVRRNDDGGEREVLPGNISIFTYPGRLSGKATNRRLSHQEYHAASTYILLNCPEVQPYVTIYINWLREKGNVENDSEINNYVEMNFMEWFREYVKDTARINHNPFIYALSLGPLTEKVKSYPVYFVNGYKFQTKKRGSRKLTSNSGVCLQSDCDEFYGIITGIIELEYPRVPIKRTVLFKCDWFDNSPKGIRRHNRYNIIDVNIDKSYPKYDPFILASQAIQVCYIPYPSESKKNKKWQAVCKVKARGVVHLPQLQSQQPTNTTPYQDDEPIGHSIPNTENVQIGSLDNPNPDSDWEIDTEEDEPQTQLISDSDTDEVEFQDDDLDDDDEDDDTDEQDEDESDEQEDDNSDDASI